MTEGPKPSLDDEESFEAIERAVLETARGRWFLAEFARRSRQADTSALLLSLSRLERVVTRTVSEPADEMRRDVARLADEINILATALSQGIAQEDDRETFTQIARSGERAAFDVAVTADAARDIGTTILEKGVNAELLRELDRHLSRLVACAAEQALIMKRVGAMGEMFRFIRQRVGALLERQGAAAQTPDQGPETAANDSAPSEAALAVAD